MAKAPADGGDSLAHDIEFLAATWNSFRANRVVKEQLIQKQDVFSGNMSRRDALSEISGEVASSLAMTEGATKDEFLASLIRVAYSSPDRIRLALDDTDIDSANGEDDAAAEVFANFLGDSEGVTANAESGDGGEIPREVVGSRGEDDDREGHPRAAVGASEDAEDDRSGIPGEILGEHGGDSDGDESTDDESGGVPWAGGDE